MVLHYNGEPEDGPVRVVVSGDTYVADSLMFTERGWVRLDLGDRDVYFPESEVEEYEPARHNQDTSHW
jgi:hypothetical protein